MNNNSDLPSYNELFGQLDFKKGDDGRAVYSPAAYLADLLQLLDDKFETQSEQVQSLEKRRPDIKKLPLNTENTYSQTPYLDIVSEVLEEKITSSLGYTFAYGVLQTAKYPFNLPFNFENERVKKFLKYLDVTLEELYKLFSLQVDANTVAREYLKLSQEEYDTVVEPADGNALAEYWGGKENFASLKANKKASQFLAITGLSGQELRELLYQNLSQTAEDNDGNQERIKAADFFINHQLNCYVELDENEEHLRCNGNSSIPEEWFQRVNRFIRLAKKIKLTFTDLDLILRSCCKNNLNEKSIQIIATVKKIHDHYEIPIDIVCSFFSDINIIGIGDDDEPQDLFNRIFNSKFANLEKKYISVSQFIPDEYSSYTRLTWSGDILSLHNKEYRKRLCKALDITEKELIYIVDKFRSWSALDESRKSLLDINQENQENCLPALSLLFRITKLSEVLDLSSTEIFNLLDILGKDPSIRSHHNFNILIDYPTQQQDCYKILEGENTDDLMWLIQILFSVVSWMQVHDFTSEELKQLLTNQYTNETAEKNSKSQKISNLNNIYQHFKPVMFNADILQSDVFDKRSANILYHILTADGSTVSDKDKRLLKANRSSSSVKALAYKALNQLNKIAPEDFMMLGIGEKVLDKIFNNLIIHEYLNAEAYLNEEKFSLLTNNFKIETDFSNYKAELFEFIQSLLADEIEFITSDDDLDDELEDELDESIEISIYPSDLEIFKELNESQRNELYDNLIFNGYIDEEGNVLQVEFFTLDDNVDNFEVNSNIGNAAEDIFNLITAQTAKYHQENLVLSREVFASLSLKEFEIDNLIDNLKFNGYLDGNNVFTNKGELLNLDVHKFNLALMFYPYRHKILAAIKKVINGFKYNFYTFSKDIFAETADRIVGQLVYEDINNQYLEEGSIKIDREIFFQDSENVSQLILKNYFTANNVEAVFNSIANIIAVYQKYRFTATILEELDFNQEEQEELIEVLKEYNYIFENRIISEDKLDYFLNIENALTFNLDKFEDYNKDIFFVLHGSAKEIDASIREVSEKLNNLAAKQELVLFGTLQDVFGIQADTIKVLCENVFQTSKNIVETFLIPILSVVNSQDIVTAQPNNNKFNFAYRRIRQFSALVSKLGLSAAETQIVFQEQNLVEKFSEHLVLPENIDSFDALIETPEGIIYIFKGNEYWAYSAETYNLLDKETLAAMLKDAGYADDYIKMVTKDNQITSLSERFANLEKVDAAFVDNNGTLYIIAKDKLYRKERGSEKWIEKERVWGKVENNFEQPEKIDAAFQDKEGKTYLFAGEQYIRYSSSEYDLVDKGYPLKIASNWQNEDLNPQLPNKFITAIDAAFQGIDDKTYLFKENHFICSDNPSKERAINEFWGKVKNNFQQQQPVDAAYVDGSLTFVFKDEQLIAYKNSLENNRVTVEDGFPMRLKSYYENLPSEFENGLDAAFKGKDGKIHLFKAGKVVSFETTDNSITLETVEETKERWGKVKNNILDSGEIDAAFVGLEGKTYLFSGEMYFRYSGHDYSQVDEGFPRTIADDWGGLNKVDAAFILDGKTYLFGTDGNDDEKVVYVRYSTNDYTKEDEGYPKAPNDNWWNLPFELVEQGAPFENIDAVFNAKDDKTYLFSGNQFIYFDRQQRWWSEPATLTTYWDSIPFNSVNAAFTGKDGKTYIFSGEEYLRYSGPHYNKIDDRYPNMTNKYWGNVVNNIAKTGKVDAALVVEFHEIIDDKKQIISHTYLFSGNQYFRYKGRDYELVEEGYPKYIATSLKEEPRFKNLDVAWNNGIDAAFTDRRNLYLFKDTKIYVVSDSLYKVYNYEELKFDGVNCAFIDEGNLYLETDERWNYCSSLEGEEVEKTPVIPFILRMVPEKFQTGLNAVLKGVDRNTYLFKNQDCFNVSLNKEYPLAEEWSRVKNNIEINGTIDAAFVGIDNKTYLFSGEQYVVYTDKLDKNNDLYVYGNIEGNPKPIQSHWGGLTSVTLAFVRDEKTYLFEKPDADGNARYVCYSSDDYSQPDPGFPQTAARDFWQIPATYTETGFAEIDAVLFQGDNMFLLSKEQYIPFNSKEERWSYAQPLSRIWRDIPLDGENRDEKKLKRVKTAFTGRDGVTYFFSDKYYVSYDKQNQFSEPLPIKNSWGIVDNNFVNNDAENPNKVDAAFVYQDKVTYLFSGNQYIRYSTQDYRFVDEGYPKLIAENLRIEPGFQNLPEAFEESITAQINAQKESKTLTIINGIVSNHQNIYIFMGKKCHIVSQALTRVYDVDIIGKIKNNLVQNNKIDAAFVLREQGQTFLFSGDRYVRYSGNYMYDYVDDGYPKAIATGLAKEIGLSEIATPFKYGIDAAIGSVDGKIYLFKNKQYLTETGEIADINETWGKIDHKFIADNNETSISAAFVSPTSHLYVFKGEQYIRYTDSEQKFVDEGFPKPIKDNWGNLPVNFEAGVDGGFVFEGRTYFLKQDDYVRYSDATYQMIDSIYPQKFKYRWGDWADYLLSDIKTIGHFKQLQETYSSDNYTLVDFFHGEQGSVTDPYTMLSEIFNWDIDEVKWLKRNNGFLGRDNLFEVRFNLELVIKLFEVFSITEKMGTSPSELYKEVWSNLYPPSNLSLAADALYRFLGLLNS